MKKIIIVVVVLMIFGCRSKKEYIHTTSTDTIYKKEIIKITPPGLNKLLIDSPCDEFGNLKPISYIIETPKSKVTIKSIGNVLEVVKSNDSIIEKETKEVSKSEKTSDKKVEVEVIPIWIWKALSISVFLNLLAGIWIFKKPF